MHRQFYSIQELLTYIQQSKGSDLKAVCELGLLPEGLVIRIRQEVNADVQGFYLTLDSYGVRHAFNGHSQERGSRDHYPLMEADLLALPEWIATPTTIVEGATKPLSMQPRRLRLEYALSNQTKTVLILEIRPKYRRLVLVTMYKTKNG